MMHPDTGHKNFLRLFATYNEKSNFNEADTRAKIIDVLFKECLGWEETNIKREEHVESGIVDYVLSYLGSPMIVIEAKKQGEYFDIPRTMTNRRYVLRGAIESVDNLKSSIEQAKRYCDDIGCKYAAISNGYQFVVFTAITIGKNWKDGHCFVFHSFPDIKENFSMLWNMLAYEQVVNKSSLIEYFEKGTRKLSWGKTISSIHYPDQCWARNRLYSYLRPISDFVFSELLDEARAEVLKQCYVYGRSSNPLTKEMEDYFVDRLPYFADKYKIKEIIERELKAGAFEKEYIERSFAENSSGDIKGGSLLLLLGGIGAGKSTFLLRFFRLVLHEHESMLWFYLDFKYAAPNEKEIETFILEKMHDEWERKYSHDLKPLLEKYGFSINSVDKKAYFQKLFNLLHLLKFSITIIVDNVDRHNVAFQEKIFLSSQHLTDFLKTITILAMREETFILSTKVGTFDAYNIPKFHIAAPNFLDMILKRIDFTINIINDKAIAKLLPSLGRAELDEIKKYFIIIKGSLAKKNEQSRKLVSFIHNVSVGNMREALAMFNNFISSGNTNIDEIFSIYDTTGDYQIAYHQYVKSIMLGEYRYYMQNRSHIMNLFDFDMSISDSHFNMLKTLYYLQERNNSRSAVGRGYVELSELLNVTSAVFIKNEVIKDSLLRLSQSNLVEYDNQSRTDIETASYVKITPGGRYYLIFLKQEFVYLDSIYIDTPISDMRLLESLKMQANLTDLERRFERVTLFLNYLISSEDDEFREHPEYLSNEYANVKFAKGLLDAFRNEEKQIRIKNGLPMPI